jgi:hypothetical protein
MSLDFFGSFFIKKKRTIRQRRMNAEHSQRGSRKKTAGQAVGNESICQYTKKTFSLLLLISNPDCFKKFFLPKLEKFFS